MDNHHVASENSCAKLKIKKENKPDNLQQNKPTSKQKQIKGNDEKNELAFQRAILKKKNCVTALSKS